MYTLLFNLDILVRRKLLDLHLSGIRHRPVSSGDVCKVPLGSSWSVLSLAEAESRVLASGPVALAEIFTPCKQQGTGAVRALRAAFILDG